MRKTATLVCINCGNEFQRQLHDIRRGRTRFCGKECAQSGRFNVNWNGGRRTDKDGYILIYKPDHPRANKGYVPEHVLVVERAMGKLLDISHFVHHFNGVKSDNRPENLIVCEDHAYHLHLHQRQRAKSECGHAGHLKCLYCGEYDEPENLYLAPNHPIKFHRECHATYEYARRHR